MNESVTISVIDLSDVKYLEIFFKYAVKKFTDLSFLNVRFL